MSGESSASSFSESQLSSFKKSICFKHTISKMSGKATSSKWSSMASLMFSSSQCLPPSTLMESTGSSITAAMGSAKSITAQNNDTPTPRPAKALLHSDQVGILDRLLPGQLSLGLQDSHRHAPTWLGGLGSPYSMGEVMPAIPDVTFEMKCSTLRSSSNISVVCSGTFHPSRGQLFRVRVAPQTRSS
jgi:hypothetical protein